MTLAVMKRKGEKSTFSRRPLCYQIAMFRERGRPAWTHYNPLASAKTVTLTNSQAPQQHSDAVCVFSQSPLCCWHKSSQARPVKCATAVDLHKASFLVFLQKKKSPILLLHFFLNPPSNHTDTFRAFSLGVWWLGRWWKPWMSPRKG